MLEKICRKNACTIYGPRPLLNKFAERRLTPRIAVRKKVRHEPGTLRTKTPDASLGVKEKALKSR